LKPLEAHLRVIVFVDQANNDLDNPYMLVWRVVNNIDAGRDIYRDADMIGIDGTNKGALDGFEREWPGDVNCTPAVLESLQKRGVLEIEDNFIDKFQL
jgi:4-hydroxy-3-polyprenylbenzoate decarboxylase